MGGRDGDPSGYPKALWKSGKFCSTYLYTLLMLALLRVFVFSLSFRTSSHGCFRCIGSSCIHEINPVESQISGCTPCTMKNPYKIQTAPGYYYKTEELLR
ncbi:hypothetical protein TNCV_3968061 [Trichonephila clavipes]|nr:hypothetical protein TNCV_3968061 [Trichonephila clavipes]